MVGRRPNMKSSERKLLRTAIAYDFDGTLAPGSIQEQSLIPKHLTMTAKAFWKGVKTEARRNDADEILTYLRRILERAHEVGSPITRAVLAAHGKGTRLFEGVSDWFE